MQLAHNMKFVIFDKLGKSSHKFARIREGYVTNGLYCMMKKLSQITNREKKAGIIVMYFVTYK